MDRNKSSKDEMGKDTYMLNSTGKIIERKRRYIPFEAKKPRERKICPNCGSLDIKKRRSTMDYKCHRCEWIGEGVKIIEY